MDMHDKFIMEDYNSRKPFASFLPSIAGIKGIPLWAFYVNRGQGICSFGIRDKDHSIMEFNPAYKSYQTVEYTGFRTFIKICSESGSKYYEPFSKIYPKDKPSSRMYIAANDFEIEETSRENGLKTNVLYFMLPEEKIGALVRKTIIKNISGKALNLEVLDGISEIIPYGISNKDLKDIGNTIKAWMTVEDSEGIPFYKLRASSNDTEEISKIDGGNFYSSFSCILPENELSDDTLNPVNVRIIADPDLIFGNNTSFGYAENFMNSGIDEICSEKQVVSNKIPCGFSGLKTVLKSGESICIYSFIGHSENKNELNDWIKKVKPSFRHYVENKHKKASEMVRRLTDDVETHTSSQLFDEYSRQCYLDNLLRGGYPLLIKACNKNFINYVYSRKHGDIERDYNFFVIEPEFYSSGNGNYRDVNQNRRCSVLFHPEVEDFDIMTFFNLTQPDGYNPLIINGYKYRLKEGCELPDVKDKIKLDEPFTIGDLYKHFSDEKFIKNILSNSEQELEAEYGEGYWSDHFSYDIDLIESYLSVYPDKEEELLFKNNKYTYYDTDVFVKPRNEKYVLTKSGVRQQCAVEKDILKADFISKRKHYKNVVRKEYGKGEIYKCSLFSKIFTLIINKYANLDSYGMGIEMEAGKPGWDDALNGLPSMFGSSMADTYELQRILNFAIKALHAYNDEKFTVPFEFYDFALFIVSSVCKFNNSNSENKSYIYWDDVNTYKEKFRKKIWYGFDGKGKIISSKEGIAIFKVLSDKLKKSINKAYVQNENRYPAFFYYDAVDYELICDNNHNNKAVKVKKFVQRKMPYFLEGPARAMKIQENYEDACSIYKDVKSSNIFDKKLNMYKINESLKELPLEVGRIRAFTPGWLENETIWMHMEYKYMLEVLKQGLYDEFFNDFRNVLPPFMNPDIYGRSIFENSSFIVSSANPDKSIQGMGFVSRLSGSTAEFLSMWSIMTAGMNPFLYENRKLFIEFKPVLPSWLFDGHNKFSFRFLGKINVTYVNSERKNTYEKGAKISSMLLKYKGSDGKSIKISGNKIPESYSKEIRENNNIVEITAFL